MVLVDTSVWIKHLCAVEPTLAQLLLRSEVLAHPLVIGELACGTLKNRQVVLRELNSLPGAESADNEEVLAFLERHRLWGKGIGFIDVHLLASALLMTAAFWTFDKRLIQAAESAGVTLFQIPSALVM